MESLVKRKEAVGSDDDADDLFFITALRPALEALSINGNVKGSSRASKNNGYVTSKLPLDYPFTAEGNGVIPALEAAGGPAGHFGSKRYTPLAV